MDPDWKFTPRCPFAPTTVEIHTSGEELKKPQAGFGNPSVGPAQASETFVQLVQGLAVMATAVAPQGSSLAAAPLGQGSVRQRPMVPNWPPPKSHTLIQTCAPGGKVVRKIYGCKLKPP